MELDALIIGAGFSGLYQLYRLRNVRGLTARVVESGDAVGGTWHWNRYPGARCDSESHAYCYTFSRELTQEWNWSERYPGPAEIQRYLNHVADRFELRSGIDFGRTVLSASFDEDSHRWHVTCDDGARYHARFLITAVGCLSTANVPNIDGLKDFNGQWYHTGQWPHEGVNFEGKRVAQVGTGSTGIQAAPVIAETAAHLTVFQRTANYSVPARNGPLSDEVRQRQKDDADSIQHIMHSNTNGHPWTINPQNAFDIDDGERQQVYEQAWETGGLKFRAAFADLLTDREANDTASAFICDKIRQIVKDPDTAASLSNIDHPYSAKRPPIDTRYFETFNRPNVSLVDLKKTPISKIDSTGIQTTGGHHAVDIIVFATGFDAMTGSLLKMDIKGRRQTLAEAWEAGPSNYLGLQVAGFPNLFTITGPGSPSVLSNMPVSIEQHVEWISDCIDHVIAADKTCIECTDEAMSGWVQHANDVANATLLPTVKHSWYLGANVPGKPQVFMPYAGGLDQYRQACNEVAQQGYKGFILS
jgi:cation diffusion facilitator CzcD-associated flavoprotein CzcO